MLINIIGKDFPPHAFWSLVENDGRDITALSIRIFICNAYFGDCFSKISTTNTVGSAVSISKPLSGMNPIRDAQYGRLQKLNDQIGTLQKELDATKEDKESLSSKNLEFQARVKGPI